ncbi:MAG: ParM/StbA family protein [Desulfosarcina sp.]|nr:ParM/StbA family protein [Desulfobacterales bacterium]
MKNRIKLIGVELGFGFTKGFDGHRPIIMQSVLADRGRPDDEPGSDRNDQNQGFHILIGDQALFVGRRADCDWRSPRHPHQPDRLFGDYGQRLTLAILAAYTEMENPLQLVIGLPVSYFQHLRDPFVNRLTGYHKVSWMQADGSRVPKNIHIHKVHVVPNPMGTYIGLIMDENGQVRDDRFKGRKVVLVDIGFRSTDVIMMDRMRFSSPCSGTIDLGISRSFEAIDRKLRDEAGHGPRFDQLYQGVRMGFIRIDGQTYNLERVREEAFRNLAEELADNIGHMLAAAWDLDRLLLTGGGARELADYIGPLLPGEVSLIENEQDARLNNVQGQLRLARALWGLSGFCDSGG